MTTLFASSSPRMPAEVKVWTACVLLLALGGTPSLARAQLLTTVVDRDGVAFSCVTVGPLAPIAQEYCVRRTLAQGFVLKRDIGVSGLTLQDAAEGAVIAAAAPGSAAAKAGLLPGDVIVAVDGRSVIRTPADVAAQLAFGARGAPIRLALSRDGRQVERSFARGPAPEPADAPHSPNILVGVHPMMNWRGEFVPCMGAGVLGPVAVGVCLTHYRPLGFVQTSALGSADIGFADASPADGAPPSAGIVSVGPAAVAADVRVGDQVSAIDGRPLSAAPSATAEALLFGKAGSAHRTGVLRHGQPFETTLVLGARP